MSKGVQQDSLIFDDDEEETIVAEKKPKGSKKKKAAKAKAGEDVDELVKEENDEDAGVQF